MSWQLATQLLSPAGDGIFTVSSGSEYKHALQRLLYGAPETAHAAWQTQLAELTSRTCPLVLGVPADAGGGICRGAAWGPLFIRHAWYPQLASNTVLDLGDIRVIPHCLHDKYLNDTLLQQCRQALFSDPASPLPVSPLSMLEYVLEALFAVSPARPVLILGGDHSLSYATVGVFAKHMATLGKRCGVLHFDAHADCMPERLGFDLCFATWVPHVLALLPDPAALVQIGIRATPHPKAYYESKFGLKQIWAKEVQQLGAAKICNQIKHHLAPLKLDGLFISFDVDGLDASHVAATGTPEPGGLALETALEIINTLGTCYPVLGADIMEIAPFTCPVATRRALEPESTLNCTTQVANALLHVMPH